ncbi:MAK10-like protein [Tanacetum coccineum]
MQLHLFQFSLHDQSSNWLERLPAGSISTWEDLTNHFLSQFFSPGRIAKLLNDILMFQQHYNESLSKAWTRFKDVLQNSLIMDSRALIEDLSLYDNESWNDPRDFAKPVKAISFPHDVSKASDRRLIKLENQVQRLMEAHLAPKPSVQVNKNRFLCVRFVVPPHDTQYYMENLEQAFVNYASSCNNEVGGKLFTGNQEPRNFNEATNAWKIGIKSQGYRELEGFQSTYTEILVVTIPFEKSVRHLISWSEGLPMLPEPEPGNQTSPEFVLEPVYPEFLPPEDEVFPAEEGDDDNDDDESSNDDEDDDDDVEEKEEEDEEEHLASVDSVPPPVYRVAKLLAIPTLPPSPLSPLSSPLPQILSPLPQILSLPLPISPPPLPTSLTYPLGYRADMIRVTTIKDTTLSYHIPLPTPITTFASFPPTDCRVGCFSEVTLPPQMRLCIALGLRYEIRQDPEREVNVMVDHRKLVMTWLRTFAGDTSRVTDVVKITRAPKRTTRSTPATTTTLTTSVTDEKLKRLIDQGVANALAACNVERSRNGEDIDDSGMGVRRQAPPARECTYPDFLKCKPLYFKGTEGVIELTQWFERMGTMFRISNCSVENKIKFATCTLLRSALTWCRVLSLEDKAHLTGEDCNNSYFRSLYDVI